MSQTATGSIASGVYGSGGFPFILFLFIVSTALLIKELVGQYDCCDCRCVTLSILQSKNWNDVWM